MNGRKRQLLVGIDGGIWFAQVRAANEPDGNAALNFAADILCQNERLKKIYGDQAYNGVFARKMREFNIKSEKASRLESVKGFVPVGKRWVVERSIVRTNLSGDWSKITNTQYLLRRPRLFLPTFN